MTWTIRPRSRIQNLTMISEGQGDPLIVLIHGVGLRAEAWGAQLAGLSHLGSLRAVDMPGHGGSAGLPDGAKLGDFTDAVAAVIDRPAVVIGHSMGAMIALDLAVRYPQSVLGVAALNAIYRRGVTAQKAVIARAKALNANALPDPEPTLERWFGNTESAARAACRAWLMDVEPAGYTKAYRVFATSDAPDDADLERLAMPSLFATGADEPNSTPWMSNMMAQIAPSGRAHAFENAAHMMPMTHAAALNEMLCDFVTECTS